MNKNEGQSPVVESVADFLQEIAKRAGGIMMWYRGQEDGEKNPQPRVMRDESFLPWVDLLVKHANMPSLYDDKSALRTKLAAERQLFSDFGDVEPQCSR